MMGNDRYRRDARGGEIPASNRSLFSGKGGSAGTANARPPTLPYEARPECHSYEDWTIGGGTGVGPGETTGSWSVGAQERASARSNGQKQGKDSPRGGCWAEEHG